MTPIKTLALALLFAATLFVPATGMAQSGTEADSRKHLQAFATTVGTMAGAVSVCDPREAEYIRQCAFIIIGNWDTFAGMPKVNDPAFPAKLEQIWQAQSARAATVQGREQPMTCGAVLSEAARSPIWRICQHPVRKAAPAMPSRRSAPAIQ